MSTLYNQVVQTGSETVPNPAAAITVTVGFKPRFVIVYNINDLAEHQFILGMTNGYSLKRITDGTLSSVTSNGITLTSSGFIIGTAIADTAADVLRWVAYR